MYILLFIPFEKFVKTIINYIFYELIVLGILNTVIEPFYFN